MSLKSEALEYHSRRPPGKLEITPTKPCLTQRDLALAYTPGVAVPCLEIQNNPDDAYRYTNRANLVAVITNGTAVLGLGDIGPLAGKPVMEGKALLFKRFADIDAIDLEVDTKDPDLVIQTVKLLEPSFGGVNLEDIKAPECFIIEQELRKSMRIPVFHDDQHGTAIISGAALLNALELNNKKISDVRIVFSGAGASAISCAKFYVLLGARRENITLCDSKGVIHDEREDKMNAWKRDFAHHTKARILAQALQGADVFVGLSVAGVMTVEMAKSMAPNPIIFALANPDPEISYEQAKAARPDAIVATGRSDYPNQVNNVLGFPFIFRGALDVRATQINEEMKTAAAHALAALAREEAPDTVLQAYQVEHLSFGPDYIIPKPLDPRVLLWVAPAVARAAIDSGAARIQIDHEPYIEQLEDRLGRSYEVMRIMFNKAKRAPKRIVFADGARSKVLRAARELVDEGLAHPILLGPEHEIRNKADELQLELAGIDVVDPATDIRRGKYIKRIFELRRRKGVTSNEAADLITKRNYFASVMVEEGDADGMISGLTFHYPDSLRPPMQIIRTEAATAAGVCIMMTRNRVLFFADTTVNIDPDAENLAEIAILTAQLARDFGVEPRVAMLSYSNFGSVRNTRTEKVRQAVEILSEREPDLVVDGDMQADTALCEDILRSIYPFSRLQREANVLIFPSLEAGNISYKIARRVSNAEVIGPLLVGMRKPVIIMQRGDDVKDIVNSATVAVVQAQDVEQQLPKNAQPLSTRPTASQ